MTRKQLSAALSAWSLAIRERVEAGNEAPILKLATAYAAHLHVPREVLTAVGGCFDLDCLGEIVDELED